MHLTHIRKTDLNLLPALAALLDERSISKAAARHHLSQPAMSRALQRLRGVFADELLVRTAQGYALTTRARLLQDELQVVLPRIDRLLRGDTFNPATAEDRFRLCCPDYMSRLIAAPLAALMEKHAPRAQLEVVAWHEQAFEDAARGRVDAILWSNKAPPPMRSKQILLTDMVCVLSADHPLARRRLTMANYLSCSHVMVTVLTTGRTMVDDQLVAAGHRRRIGLRTPYFGSAIKAVEKTASIATVPRAAAQQYAQESRVRIVAPPFDFEPIRILMSWHPSADGEPSLQWFRKLVEKAAGDNS